MQIVPRLVHLCYLLAGNALSEDEDVDSDEESERDGEEEDAKIASESEDEEDEESEATSKEEHRYSLLLLVCGIDMENFCAHHFIVCIRSIAPACWTRN